MNYFLCTIYKAIENNYKQVRNLRPLLEQKITPLQRLARK